MESIEEGERVRRERGGVVEVWRRHGGGMGGGSMEEVC